MRSLLKVATVEDLPPGRGMTTRVDGGYLAIFNVDGEFYALNGSCPHMGGLLGNGTLQGCIVKCPEHGLRIDVTTGKVPGGQLGTRVYPVQIVNGDVMVSIDE